MALKPCRECGREVSDSAPKCPHCGIDHPGNTGMAAANKIQSVGCLLTLLITVPFLVMMCAIM